MVGSTKMEQMRVLVTGAAGFIGWHTVKALLACGHEVVAVDNLSRATSTGDAFRKLNPEAWFVKKDVETLTLAQFNVTHCLHLACDLGIENSQLATTTNTLGFTNIITECMKNNVRLVYASSAAVYGIQNRFPASESDVVNPVSVYGIQKLYNEKIANVLYRRHLFRSIGLRYFNVCGRDGHGVLPCFRKSIVSGKVVLFNNLSTTRDYIHVDDVVQANISALEASHHDIINISSGVETGLEQIVRFLKNHYKFTVEDNLADDIWVSRSCGDNTKMCDVLVPPEHGMDYILTDVCL